MFVVFGNPEKCTNCKTYICVEECPGEALLYDFNTLFYSFNKCCFCEVCSDVCDSISLREVI